MAAGMLPPCDTAAACHHVVWWQMYINRNFWFVHLFFENQRRKNIYIKSMVATVRGGAKGGPAGAMAPPNVAKML
jgi:hypothetical protein